MRPSIRCSSEVVLTTYDEDLVVQTSKKCLERIGGQATCAFVFVSSDWKPYVDEIVEIVRVYGHAVHVFGCSGSGFVATGQEDENISGFCLTLLHMPSAILDVCRVSPEDIQYASGADHWQRVIGVDADRSNGFIILADPTEPGATESMLQGFNAAFPGVPCFGGNAAGGLHDDSIFIFDVDGITDCAALVISVGGGVKLEGIVSQGCRPIGKPYTITEVDENVLVSIASRSAYEVLEEAYSTLDEEERERARGNIFVGLAIDEYLEDFKRGDFLVRNIHRGSPHEGELEVGAEPRVGQTMQFQFRDRDAADEDLRVACRGFVDEFGIPEAGLVFPCGGRGIRMFGVPNHDAGIMEETFGPVPIGGFFCAGEIAPVSGINFMHFYSVAAAFFVEA